MHAGAPTGPRSPNRRRTVAVAAAVAAVVLGSLLLTGPASAAAKPVRHVDVVQVSGWIDPVVVDFIARSIADSERTDAEALVIQLDSPGSLVGDRALDRLVRRIKDAEVPVAVWIGGSGARAKGDAGRIALAAPIVGLAPSGRLQVGSRVLGPADALRAGAVQINEKRSAVLGTFIASLDGRTVDGHRLETATLTPQKTGPPKATLDVQGRLAKLDLWPRTLHTVASPPVAYLLLLAGLALVVFELYTGGVGIAAGVGAAALVLAAYGLAILPTNPWGLALIGVGTFGFAVDVQTGVPRFWTGVGVVGLVVGSLLLYDDPVSLGWLPLVGGVVGFVLLMLAGLPATVRSRFSTPTIGRESMIGEVGETVVAVDPQGVVKVRDALWPARTNRATPLSPGDPIRVVGIEGASLEVAPEQP
jgi:membrane-bound serine protease (ClpP class)